MEEKIFPGFSFPEDNSYRFPKDLNGYFDKLTSDEFKVLSYIVRKTWGFNKIEDKISYKQFLEGIVDKEGVRSFSGLGISDYLLTKALEGLEAKSFIEITRGKGETPSSYKLKYSYPSDSGDTQKPLLAPESVTVSPEDVGHTIIKDNIVLLRNTLEPSSQKRALSIIFLFASYKKVELTEKEQKNSFIVRNIKAAQLLTGYPDLKLKRVMEFLTKTDFKWTLETVGKYIDEDIDRLEFDYIFEPKKFELPQEEVKTTSPDFMTKWKEDCRKVINKKETIEIEPEPIVKTDLGFWEETKGELEF